MVQKSHRRRIGLSILLVSLVVLSGCVTISVDSKVRSDGTIESYGIEMTMNQQVYNYLERTATQEGYSSVEKYLMSNMSSRESNAENIVYSESSNEGNKTISIRFEDYTPDENSGITVTKRNETMIYEDRTFVSNGSSSTQPGSSGRIPVHYTLTMPGEITNASTDNIEGDTATWNLTGGSQTVVYAESEISSGFGLMTMAAVGIGGLILIGLGVGAVLYYRSEGLPTV